MVMDMAEKSDALPSLAPVVVKSGPPDVGGDIWRRKCQKLKRKCEEFEQLNEILFARTKRIHVMIERAEAEKRFLIGRLEQYEDIEFPSKDPKISASHIDTASVKTELIRDDIKKEEKSRAVGPPPALLGPFPTSKQQDDSGASNAGTPTTTSGIVQRSPATTAALSLPAPQVNPKSKQPGASAASTSARAPKQKRATKAAPVSGGGKPKKESTRRKKSDADPLAPKKPSNSFFWFCQERRPALQAHFKGEGVSGQHDLTKVLAKLWSETNAEDKKKYYELYAEDKKRYDRAMEEYTKNKKLAALVAETGVDGGTSQDNSDKPSS